MIETGRFATPQNFDIKPQDSQEHPDMPRFSRRTGLLGVAGTFLKGPSPEISTTYPVVERRKGGVPFTWFYHRTDDHLDLDYFNSLFINPNEIMGTAESRMAAVTDNLMQIIYIPDGAYPADLHTTKTGYSTIMYTSPPFELLRGAANVLEVCGSGRGITAAHNLVYLDDDAPELSLTTMPQSLAAIYNPRTGFIYPIKEFIIDRKKDLAFLLYPTGLRREPVRNLKLSSRKPQKGEGLWAAGLFQEGDSKPFRSQPYLFKESGRVTDRTLSDGRPRFFSDNDMVRTDGLVPVVGTSGGAVCSSDGSVVAIISGYVKFFGNDNKTVVKTVGRVAPLVPVERLDNRVIYTYENNGVVQSRASVLAV